MTNIVMLNDLFLPPESNQSLQRSSHQTSALKWAPGIIGTRLYFSRVQTVCPLERRKL